MSLFRGSEDSGNREFGGRDGMGGTVKTGKQALVQIQQSPNRPLYIMIWSRALFKAHWSFWVPNLEGIRTNGKRAHVEGDVRGGFHLEFMRNYDIAQTTSQPTIIEIGAMRVEDLLDTPLGGQRLKENVPRDQFEIVAASITAPQGSLNRVNEQPCTSEASQRTFQNAGPVYPSPSRSTDQRQVSHEISDSCIY